MPRLSARTGQPSSSRRRSSRIGMARRRTSCARIPDLPGSGGWSSVEVLAPRPRRRRTPTLWGWPRPGRRSVGPAATGPRRPARRARGCRLWELALPGGRSRSSFGRALPSSGKSSYSRRARDVKPKRQENRAPRAAAHAKSNRGKPLGLENILAASLAGGARRACRAFATRTACRGAGNCPFGKPASNRHDRGKKRKL